MKEFFLKSWRTTLKRGVFEQLIVVEGLTNMNETVNWVKLKAVGILKLPRRVPFIPEATAEKLPVVVPAAFLKTRLIVGIV